MWWKIYGSAGESDDDIYYDHEPVLTPEQRERQKWQSMARKIDVMEYLKVIRLNISSDYLNSVIESRRNEISVLLHQAFNNATGTRWPQLVSHIFKHMEVPIPTTDRTRRRQHDQQNPLNIMMKNLNAVGFKCTGSEDDVLRYLMKTHPPNKELLQTSIINFPYVKLLDEANDIATFVDATIDFYKHRSQSKKSKERKSRRMLQNRAFTESWRPKLMIPK
jgi:hypothetical protein